MSLIYQKLVQKQNRLLLRNVCMKGEEERPQEWKTKTALSIYIEDYISRTERKRNESQVMPCLHPSMLDGCHRLLVTRRRAQGLTTKLFRRY